jgi:uncharacterized protein
MKTATAALSLAALALGLAGAGTAAAQSAATGPLIAAGNTLLTVSAEGHSVRTPDLAVFNAGITTQAKTASAALTDNARAMNDVIAALKKAGIADRDIQTSNLSVNPVYAPQRVQPDGSVEAEQIIAGYQATNQVQVRQRKINEFGKVIDTLVAAGANQVSGPAFQLDNPDAATDEARIEAMKKARARADLYARAAGLTVKRVLTISDGGGTGMQPPVMFARAEKMMASGAPSPVAAGELDLSANVTVTYELAP